MEDFEQTQPIDDSSEVIIEEPITEELSNDETLTLVMNNYRSSGAGGYEFYENCKIIKEILVEMPTIPPASWNATIVPLFSQPLIWIFGPVVT